MLWQIPFSFGISTLPWVWNNSSLHRIDFATPAYAILLPFPQPWLGEAVKTYLGPLKCKTSKQRAKFLKVPKIYIKVREMKYCKSICRYYTGKQLVYWYRKTVLRGSHRLPAYSCSLLPGPQAQPHATARPLIMPRDLHSFSPQNCNLHFPNKLSGGMFTSCTKSWETD